MSEPTASRRLAFGVLLEIDRGGQTLAERLAAPAIESLPTRDRAFLHELVLGTLRARGAVDHALAAVVDRPLDALDAGVLPALRLGAYQILRLRVPPRAAVSESVELVRATQPKAAGFVNAVLRRLVREGAPAFPNPDSDALGWLTSEGSLPRWVALRWVARLGEAAAVARARAFLETPAPVYRLNPRAPDASARVEAAGLAPRALVVPGAWEATAGRATDLAAAGVLYLQDEGSQLVAHLAARDGRLLDACAAPGGKATLMADLIGERGLVIAAEASLPRLRTLASLSRRWGAPNLHLIRADALRPSFGTVFDAVLLDAPCSGLGTLGRHPDIRWRTGPEELSHHARRQRALLEALASVVKPAGRLVYAVCSAEPEENEDVVDAFLERHREFEPEPLPAWASPFSDGRFARCGPARGGDAFFAAVLRKL